MDYLDSAKPPKLKQEVNNPNRPVTNGEIEIVIKSPHFQRAIVNPS